MRNGVKPVVRQVLIFQEPAKTLHTTRHTKMESKSRRQDIYKNQQNLSPERKSKKIRRSSSSHGGSQEYKYDQTEEINESARRKYKRQNSKHDENNRISKVYGLKTYDRSVLKKPKLSHSTKEGTEFKVRNSQSKKAVNTEMIDERNEGEIRQHKKYENYGLKSQDRSLPTGASSTHTDQYNRKTTNRRKSERKEAVYKQLNEMLSIERHHTRYVDRSTSGNFTSGNSTSGEVKYVRWCPQYINPDIQGHVRGGTSLLHHRCRRCRKICFHLLGQPGTTRLCLGCSGYKEKYIPDWYYHKRCRHCQ